ncbi:MAG: hypothetical protein ACAI25_17075 [Planctomycetota bacterium]
MDFFTNLFKDAARSIGDFVKNHVGLLALLGLGGVAAALLLALAPSVGDLAKAGDTGAQESAQVAENDPAVSEPKDQDPPVVAENPDQEQFVLTGTVVRAPDGRHGIEMDGKIYLPYYAPMQRMLGQFTGRVVSMTVHKQKPRENEIRLGEVPVFVHSVDLNASAIEPIELSEDVTIPGGAPVTIVWGDRGRFKIEYQGATGWVDYDALDIEAPVAQPSGYSVPAQQTASAPSQTTGMSGALK